MGFLNFGKKRTAAYDPDLDDLTVEEADFLRRLLAEMWPASEGTITLHGEYAQSSSGGQFGLYNLSRAAKAEPRQNWPQVVERHISGLLSRRSEPGEADLSDDEILSLVKARVIASSYLPESHREAFTYRRTIASGLEAILMLDFPESASAVPDAIVSRFDSDSLWKTAIDAVSAEPLDEFAALEVGSGRVLAAMTDSLFTASHVLDLPALLSQAGVASARHGVLFAVPSRHELLLHVVESPSATSVVSELTQLAQLRFSRGVGEISPEVFYWSDPGYERVTYTQEDGVVNLDGTGAFFAAVNGF